MAKDPSVLFYTQDFLIGSSLLTPVQKGHYITLLCYQQQSDTGSLPLTQIQSIMNKDYAKHWPIIKSKFKEDEAGFFNERMRKEIEKRRKFSDKQKQKIDKRWSDKNTYPGNTPVYTPVIPNNGNTFLENENENDLKGGVGEKPALGIELVSEIGNKAWNDQRWREAVCMGHRLSIDELKLWMAQYNTSICNDYFPDFNESKYKKLLGGWINKQKAKGYSVSAIKQGLDSTLKKV